MSRGRLSAVLAHVRLRSAAPLPPGRALHPLAGVAGTPAAATGEAVDVTLFTAKSTFPAFNGWKITILLEELASTGALASFTVRELDLDGMEHKQPWYLEINPNGRIPAIVDHSADNFAVFESGAIMLYLAERCGALMPTDTAGRYEVIQWLCFQLSGVGPMQGQAHAFVRYVPDELPYAISRYQGETRRLYEVLDGRLAEAEFVAGEYSIADISLYPWVAYHEWAGVSLEGLPHLVRWCDAIAARPAVQRGLEYNPKPIAKLLEEADAIRDTVGSTTLDKASTKRS